MDPLSIVEFHWVVVHRSEDEHAFTERTALVDGRHRLLSGLGLLLALDDDEVFRVGLSMLKPGGTGGLALVMRDAPHAAVADRGPHVPPIFRI